MERGFVIGKLENGDINKLPNENYLTLRSYAVSPHLTNYLDKNQFDSEHGDYHVYFPAVAPTFYSDVYKGQTKGGQDVAVKIGNPFSNKTPNHNLIHGDLKSPNVLIDKNRRPVLIDFGLCNWNSNYTKLRGYSEEYTPLNVLAKNKWDVKDEIYSFAVIIYASLTNRFPVVELGQESDKRYYGKW